MEKRQILLLSSSTVHGSGYLQYVYDEIDEFLKKNNVKQILFVPYAAHSYGSYTMTVQNTFKQIGYDIVGIHRFKDPIKAVNKAQALYVGGGNTFLLLKGLYDNNLIETIKYRVFKDGLPYIGSSAGTNVATTSICTTNDMPIVYPPSFSAIGLVPFNINPHYLDDNPEKHMGETREERIKQYHELLGVPPVIGLREGGFLHIEGSKVTLKGNVDARIFIPGKKPEEYVSGSDLSSLLENENSIEIE